MTLRARLGIAAGVAVAIAVIAVVVSAYAGTRSELTGQIDNALRNRVQQVLSQGNRGGGDGGAPRGVFNGDGPGGGQPRSSSDPDEGLGFDRLPPRAFGGASGTLTLVYSSGRVYKPAGQTSTIPADDRAKALARSGRGQYFTAMTVNRTHIRVLATGIGSRGALLVALPLTDIDHALHNQLLLMIAIGAGGIALAALLGLLVARTALEPIARFTRKTEAIASAPERLDQRVEVSGNDELARLARTFNATLGALERSVEAQRNLVADASHELRTPIATLRANLQLLLDEGRLSGSDRDALRQDMIEELDELTGLVGDVVELARGTKQHGEPGDVRLDQIVSREIEHVRRRAPEMTVTAMIEPTLVRGEGDRIARAVANLLDNARKWSPPEGEIEVLLEHGVLSVRDHGPGFHDHDLPFVFDRFHRAGDARSKPGSGLGLAIVRQAAEAHGGSADASNAPGGGAIIRLSFGEPLALADELVASAGGSAAATPD